MSGSNRYRRLTHLTGRRQDVKGLPVDEDVEREIEAHIEELVDELVSEGLEPEAARTEARRRFGVPGEYLTASRRSARRRERRLRLGALIDALRIESGQTVRALWKRPGFSLAAILILGVGIGATVTIYTVFDTVLLRPLPYHRPEQLVQIIGPHGFSPVEFTEWRERTESYQSIAAVWDWYAILRESDQPEQIHPLLVTGDFLEMFDAGVLLGRSFREEEYLGESGAAILEHGWWSTRWAADPDIIGRSIIVNDKPVTVIGVLEPSFRPPEGVVNPDVDLYMPLDLYHPDLQTRGFSILSVMARLETGRSFISAQAEADALVEQIALEHPGERYRRNDGTVIRYRIMPLLPATIRGVAPAIILLLGAVGFMLLIACADVASLLLARGVARSREMALRGALGASQRRVLLQFLSEGVVLSIFGGVAGIFLARTGVDLLVRYGPSGIPRLAEVGLDERILIAALVITLFTGLLSGLLPALRVVRWDLGSLLKDVSIGATEALKTQRLQGRLVIAEVALALVLTFGAVQTMRSLVAMVDNHPGFEVTDLYTVPVVLMPGFTDEHRNRMAGEVLDRIRAIPTVTAAGAGRSVPFEYIGSNHSGWYASVRDADRPEEPEPFSCIIHPVTSGYFKALGAEFLAGRGFQRNEGMRNDLLAIINGNAARQLFGTVEATGERIQIADGQIFTIIGVSRGIQHWGTTEPAGFEVYIPDPPNGAFMERISYLVRSKSPLGELVPSIQEAIWSVDATLPVDRFVSMETMVGANLDRPRFLMALFLIFAVVGLTLAAAGIHATMLFWVGQRKRALGIRMAMGASGQNMVTLTLRRALNLAGIGITIGLLFVISTSVLLRSVIWGVPFLDGMTILGVSTLIVLVTLTAAIVPAWRASRADPVEVLRAE